MLLLCLPLLLILIPSDANTCLKKRSDWNEDKSSIPTRLVGWLDSVFTGGGEKGVKSRLYDPVTEVFSNSHGDYDEDDPEERRVITIGTFVKNIPYGLTWQLRSTRRLDGFLYGLVDQEGRFTGDDLTFIYPDLLTGLRGMFVNGVLQQARAVDVVSERCAGGKKELIMEPSDNDSDVVWKKHKTNTDYIGQHPRVMDPHEMKSVHVADSKLDAEEGLFAKRIFSPGDLISYYSGHKTYLGNIIDPNSMTDVDIVEAASYLYSLGHHAPAWWNYPRDLLLDVGVKYRSTGSYRTTLAHKANHKFGGKNSHWDVVIHPVVGGIACLVASKEIDEGDEIYVDYNYDIDDLVPTWYTEALNSYVLESTMREQYPEYWP